ncbi:hypothetical protein RF11_11558 [Thelohanellus kitauei]|uniref:Uncharacterized protein n=1 Tax=Thelohanellus kitauei TaxID=669202 RepID=A0A0C2NHU1_THEKT|nr:hypothetical protein RF11_11558 [Thelohanellus kitauei]
MNNILILVVSVFIHIGSSIKFHFTLHDYDVSVDLVAYFNASFTSEAKSGKVEYHLFTETMKWGSVMADKRFVIVTGKSKDKLPGNSLTIQLTYGYYPDKGFKIPEILLEFDPSFERKMIVGGLRPKLLFVPMPFYTTDLSDDFFTLDKADLIEISYYIPRLSVNFSRKQNKYKL